MTPAERVRRALADARRNGLAFEEAWPLATGHLPQPRATSWGRVSDIEPQLWANAIHWAYVAFRRAYERSEDPRARPVKDLEPAPREPTQRERPRDPLTPFRRPLAVAGVETDLTWPTRRGRS